MGEAKVDKVDKVESVVLFEPQIKKKKLRWRRTKTGNSRAKLDDHQFVVTASKKSERYGYLVFKDGVDGPQYGTYRSYRHETEREAKRDALQFVHDRTDLFGNDGLQRTFEEVMEALEDTEDPFDGSVNYWGSCCFEDVKTVDQMSDEEYEAWWDECGEMDKERGGQR